MLPADGQSRTRRAAQSSDNPARHRPQLHTHNAEPARTAASQLDTTTPQPILPVRRKAMMPITVDAAAPTDSTHGPKLHQQLRGREHVRTSSPHRQQGSGWQRWPQQSVMAPRNAARIALDEAVDAIGRLAWLQRHSSSDMGSVEPVLARPGVAPTPHFGTKHSRTTGRSSQHSVGRSDCTQQHPETSHATSKNGVNSRTALHLAPGEVEVASSATTLAQLLEVLTQHAALMSAAQIAHSCWSLAVLPRTGTDSEAVHAFVAAAGQRLCADLDRRAQGTVVRGQVGVIGLLNTEDTTTNNSSSSSSGGGTQAVHLLPSCLLDGLCHKDLSKLAWALAKLDASAPPVLWQDIERAAAGQLASTSPQVIANLLWAFATAQQPCPALLSAATSVLISKQRSRFTPQAVANLSWSFAKLGYKQLGLWQAVADLVPAAAPLMSGRQVANCAWGFAATCQQVDRGGQSDVAADLADSDLHDAASSRKDSSSSSSTERSSLLDGSTQPNNDDVCPGKTFDLDTSSQGIYPTNELPLLNGQPAWQGRSEAATDHHLRVPGEVAEPWLDDPETTSHNTSTLLNATAQLPQLNASDVVTAGASAAIANALSTLQQRAQQLLPSLDDHSLALLMWAFATAGAAHIAAVAAPRRCARGVPSPAGSSLSEASNISQQGADASDARVLGHGQHQDSAGDSGSTVSAAPCAFTRSDPAVFIRAGCQAAAPRLSTMSMSNKDLAMMLVAAARARVYCKPFMIAARQQVTLRAAGMTPQELANAAWFFAVFTYYNENLFSSLATAARQCMASLPVQALATIAWSLAEVKHYDAAFFNQLSSHLLHLWPPVPAPPAHNPGIMGVDLAGSDFDFKLDAGLEGSWTAQFVDSSSSLNTPSGVRGLGMQHTTSLQNGDDNYRNSTNSSAVSNVPVKDLTMLILAFAEFNHYDPVIFQYMSRSLSTRIWRMSCRRLINQMWAFAVLQHFDETFFTAAFQRLASKSAHRIGFPGIMQLCQVHILSEDLFGGLPGLAPQLGAAARAHALKVWRTTSQRSLTSSQFQQDITIVLKLLGLTVQQECMTVDGLFSIDTAVEWAGRQVAVEADGPWHFSFSRPHVPLAHSIMKWRCLKLRGWRVLSIPYFMWNTLGTDLDAKKRYLLDALEGCSVSRAVG